MKILRIAMPACIFQFRSIFDIVNLIPIDPWLVFSAIIIQGFSGTLLLGSHNFPCQSVSIAMLNDMHI